MRLRQRYQHGCLTRKSRTRGGDVWEFRFYETTAEGSAAGGRYLSEALPATPPWPMRCARLSPSGSDSTSSPD